MGSKSFAARRVRDAIVYAHTATAPSDAEWDEALSFYDSLDPSAPLRTLVYTEGAAPNAAQRARLNSKLGGRRARIAVLTGSPLARAAGVAISWFRPDIGMFAPQDFDKAVAHLEVSADFATELRQTLAELKAQLKL